MADSPITIIGAGVVGLAIAAELSKNYSPVILLERNSKFGQETSSRNSEVIHAGLYYGKDTLKTRLCVEGNPLLYEFCEKHKIFHKRLTKIITAVSKDELPELEKLFLHGKENGVQLEILTKEEVIFLEPNINSFGGIYSPSSGIISAHELMDSFYHIALENGTLFQPNAEVIGLEKQNSNFVITIKEPNGTSKITSEKVINCAGLECDTIAQLAGIDIEKAGYQLHYCKGSYFALPGKFNNIVSRLIYPMPTKHSLGVHALIDLSGRIKFGPDVEYLADRIQDYKVDESKRKLFADSVRRILPFVVDEDLTPEMSGIRPKLQAQGEPMRDFIIEEETSHGLSGLINLIGIESPGLTSSLAIAKHVSKLL